MQIYKIETEDNGRERTIHGSYDFPCASYDERFSEFFGGEVAWHWHDEIEIVLVAEGATKVESIESCEILHAGEMILVNANTLHKLTNHGEEDCRILNVVFNPQWLGGSNLGLVYKKHMLPIINNKSLLLYKFHTYCQDAESSPNSDSNTGQTWHQQAIDELASAFDVWESQRTDREFYMTIALLKFWHLFSSQALMQSHDSGSAQLSSAQGLMLQPSESTAHRPLTTQAKEKRVQSLLQFIHRHYKERLSIADISYAANISESECYRTFRDALKSTPNHYLLEHRLRQSLPLLTETNQSIANVAYEVGFNCSAYFAKKFKIAFQMTPKQFRKKHQKTKTE
ncbi:AraC family transcriptional regulator [Marinomonas sp. TI.3.20]|uniref:AraC family transcriptional regulator n=1 Tax=Marinomonas sp. TI.3.20 TaxID=3121296 RepID=UPI00311FF4DB